MSNSMRPDREWRIYLTTSSNSLAHQHNCLNFIFRNLLGHAALFSGAII